MSEAMTRLQEEIIALLEEIHGGHIIDHPGLTPNPFAPIIPLVLLGLLLTAVLLVDQIRHKSA
jgi:hypothetical protein